MAKQIALLAGDGIGPEVMAEAVLLLHDVMHHTGETFTLVDGAIGGDAIDTYGNPLPDETIALCKNSDAVLLASVGGPQWDHLTGSARPEAGLLRLRKELDVFSNVRPIRLFSALKHASPLRADKTDAVDMLIVRELTGGLYFGQPKERRMRGELVEVVDTLVYTEAEIERILHSAFQLAQRRSGKLVSVDKANVLESSRLWREVANRIAPSYPDVTLSHMLVDAMAMQMVQQPAHYDVVVMENLFGDILSDLGGAIVGSLGLLPSASLSEAGPHLYEPVHGSAPDIAGKGIANPLGMLLSVAMMLDVSFGMDTLAKHIQLAIENVLEAGYRTEDIMEAGMTRVSTGEMGAHVRTAFANIIGKE